jgi:hypothetical protein
MKKAKVKKAKKPVKKAAKKVSKNAVKKVAKAQLRKPRKPKPVLINVKLDKKVLDAIGAQARKYAGGNVSLWLRYAGVHCVPKRKDLSP